MSSARHVVLLGLMGSGKTTVGRLLAARLDRPFLDNDELLEASGGRSAREIAAAAGADALHRREAEVLVETLARPVAAVIAAAAAAPLEPGAGAALAGHDVVYLRVAPAVLTERLGREPDDGHRPFIAGGAARLIAAQFAGRDERYRELAALVVDAGREPSAVADEISSTLERQERARQSSRTPPGS